MDPVQIGDQAPDFSLPAAPGPDRVTLSEFRGRPVVLLFFPLAFSGVCTDEMCRMAEDWSAWNDTDATVLGISVDSPFVNRRFKEETGVAFPLLSDFNKEAARAYGVLEEDYFGMKGVSKRAAFVVDREGAVAYRWVGDDAGVMPPLPEILKKVKNMG